MFHDWAFAQRGYGIVVLPTRGSLLVVEFNELLKRIASGAIQAEDRVISRVFTDGKRLRVGDLRVYGMVRSGEVPTADLPCRVPNGVLASGAKARALLRAIENGDDSEAAPNDTLLRAVSPPLPDEMLRAVKAALSPVSSEELLRPSLGPWDLPPYRKEE
jgi:hypothetical protein